MIFIGIISDRNEYENVKKHILEENSNIHIQFFHITNKNIENFQNIKFDAIVIMKELRTFIDKIEILVKMIKQVRYLICDSDISIDLSFDKSMYVTVITYGFNPKATVVVTSVTEEKLLIDIQRAIVLNNQRILESGENVVNYKMPLKTNENLVIFIISLIFL